MTRDNPHMHLPEGGSTMSGVERARALKHVKVRVGDLGNNGGIGHIGFAVVHPEIELGNLNKSRQYV
jgi:hypothetical protein